MADTTQRCTSTHADCVSGTGTLPAPQVKHWQDLFGDQIPQAEAGNDEIDTFIDQVLVLVPRIQLYRHVLNYLVVVNLTKSN
eukprot:SAG31_NODE_691_length_12779_cov_19.035095_16_plen_82_part_00